MLCPSFSRKPARQTRKALEGEQILPGKPYREYGKKCELWEGGRYCEVMI
jgi:hypothetical protein